MALHIKNMSLIIGGILITTTLGGQQKEIIGD